MASRIDQCFSDALTAFMSEQYSYCIKKCEEGLVLDSTRADLWSLKGNALLLQEQNEKAEEAFKYACQLSSNSGEVYFNLGNALFGQQKYSEAVKAYSTALELDCSDEIKKKIYFLVGTINQASLNNSEDALLNYEKSEQISGVNNDQFDILLRKIQIYIEQRNFAKAESCAMQLKLLIPSEFKSYQLLFQIYLEQKKTTEAAQVLEEVEANLSLESENIIELGFDKAMLSCFMAEQDTENAECYYKKALQQLASLENNSGLSTKDQCEILLTSADIYIKLEQHGQSIEFAKRVIALTDKETDLIEYRERAVYTLLTCADIAKDYASVSEYARLLKNSENLFYRHHGYYAEAYASKMNNTSVAEPTEEYVRLYEIAIAYYKNAVISSPGDILAYLYRAKSYVDIGEYDRAREIAELLPEDSKKQLYEYISEVEKG